MPLSGVPGVAVVGLADSGQAGLLVSPAISVDVTWSSPATPVPWGKAAVGPFTVDGTLSPFYSYKGSLASGNNPLTVPDGCTGFIFTPPVGNAVGLLLKGATGDEGISIPPGRPFFYVFDPELVPAAIYVDAAGDIDGEFEVVFF